MGAKGSSHEIYIDPHFLLCLSCPIEEGCIRDGMRDDATPHTPIVNKELCPREIAKKAKKLTDCP